MLFGLPTEVWVFIGLGVLAIMLLMSGWRGFIAKRGRMKR